MLRLDLGAGLVSPPGYTPMGAAHGSDIYPLRWPDRSAQEIRCAHALEHFPHGQIAAVLADWVRVLKPGGRLRIAVPDFEKIAQNYLDGVQQPTQSFLMGGQTDALDYHKALFDSRTLRKALSEAGLVLLRPWTSEIDDCASYPISLNIEGRKPFVSEMKVCAAMSVPRLGFMDNFFCSLEALIPLGIRLRKMGGAFWGQALTRCFEKIIEEDAPDAILTLDYDSVFTKEHVAHLIQQLMANPDVDALAPLQSSRHLPMALFTVKDYTGKNMPKINLETMKDDLREVDTAHFGLTLIRTKNLIAMPKPWFHSVPDEDGRWEDGKVDEDIAFWNSWKAAGNSLYLANRVAIGHMEVYAKFPGADLQAILQPMSEFNKSGPPEGAWK